MLTPPKRIHIMKQHVEHVDKHEGSMTYLLSKIDHRSSYIFIYRLNIEIYLYIIIVNYWDVLNCPSVAVWTFFDLQRSTGISHTNIIHFFWPQWIFVWFRLHRYVICFNEQQRRTNCENLDRTGGDRLSSCVRVRKSKTWFPTGIMLL